MLLANFGGMHPIVTSLIIIGIFFIVVFAFFSIVFIIHRRQLQQQYQIQEKFNQVAQFLAANKFKHLDLLAKSNTQLKNLMTQINDGKTLFEKQLEIVRQKIISLSLINVRYLYLRSFRLSKEIRNDLKKCELMVNNLRNISSSATAYSKNVSDLLIEYRQITDDILHFYNFNLALRYNNAIPRNIYKFINENIAQAKEYIVKFDNDKLLTFLHNLNSSVSVFYKMTSQLYTLDRVLMYLETLKKRIKSEMETASRILSSSDYGLIETAYATGSSNITQLEKNLKAGIFNDAKNNAIIAVKQLNSALNKIESGDQTNVLVQKNMKYLKAQIGILAKEFNELNTSFNKIQQNFKNAKDGSIINKITNLNTDIKYIIFFYQNLENEFANYRLIQRTEFLNKIRELSECIVSWKLLLFNLSEEIATKYKNVIVINNELSDVKLTLTQLLGLKLQFKEDDQNGIDTIKNIIEHIKILQQQLSENYFQNYQNVNEELSKIREQTSLLISSAAYSQTLKIYAQRLIYYVNKYRNEHEEISKSLTIAESLYQKGEYQHTIDQMIETVSIILSSAKESKITIN